MISCSSPVQVCPTRWEGQHKCLHCVKNRARLQILGSLRIPTIPAPDGRGFAVVRERRYHTSLKLDFDTRMPFASTSFIDLAARTTRDDECGRIHDEFSLARSGTNTLKIISRRHLFLACLATTITTRNKAVSGA